MLAEWNEQTTIAQPDDFVFASDEDYLAALRAIQARADAVVEEAQAEAPSARRDPFGAAHERRLRTLIAKSAAATAC